MCTRFALLWQHVLIRGCASRRPLSTRLPPKIHKSVMNKAQRSSAPPLTLKSLRLRVVNRDPQFDKAGSRARFSVCLNRASVSFRTIRTFGSSRNPPDLAQQLNLTKRHANKTRWKHCHWHKCEYQPHASCITKVVVHTTAIKSSRLGIRALWVVPNSK